LKVGEVASVEFVVRLWLPYTEITADKRKCSSHVLFPAKIPVFRLSVCKL